MAEWIDVEKELPKLTETVKIGHRLDEYNEEDFNRWGEFITDCEFLQSEEVIVAEQKGDGFEEDTGRLFDSGWSSDCDNVTHWKYK